MPSETGRKMEEVSHKTSPMAWLWLAALSSFVVLGILQQMDSGPAERRNDTNKRRKHR